MNQSAEFSLEFEYKQVLVLEPFGPYYDDAIKRLGEQPSLQIVACSSLEEMKALARQVDVCLVLAHCPNESHADGFNSLLESCHQQTRAKKIRVIVTVSNDYAYLQPRFIRLGASEVIQQPISSKLLYTKLHRFLDMLPCRDKNGKLIAARSRSKTGTNAVLPHGLEALLEPEVSWRTSLNTRSDCWAIVEGKTRWIAGANKWSINLLGPPPSYGEWSRCEQLQPEAKPTEPTWEWIPNGLTDDPFMLEEGAWKFRGLKPEFKDGAWIFSGSNPKLAFYHQGASESVKVDGYGKVLLLAEDSDHGRGATIVIEQSLKHQARIPRNGDIKKFTLDKMKAPLVEKISDETRDVGQVSLHPVPDYLNRKPLDSQGRTPLDSDRFALNPLAAAVLASELMQLRGLSPNRMLWRYCEYLKSVCGGGQLEFWVATGGEWKCVQHDDLIDMSLKQKLEFLTHERIVRSGGSRAVLIRSGEQRLGALIVAEGKADVYTDDELQGFAKVLFGILKGLKNEEISLIA